MVFLSSIFLLIFLKVTLLGYYLIRKSFRNAFLLLMSLAFHLNYADFALSIFNRAFYTVIPLLGIMLLICMPLFTFQGMPHTSDVHLDKVTVQKKLQNVALYVSLFPQLVADPIVCYTDMNDQINKRNQHRQIYLWRTPLSHSLNLSSGWRKPALALW